MIWIIFVYVVLSIVLSISAGATAGIVVGVAFAAGSVLAVAVGGGLRASLLGPTKQKVWGSVIATRARPVVRDALLREVLRGLRQWTRVGSSSALSCV